MPLIGWFLGSRFQALISGIDHWVAFVLLAVIGINMIREALKPDDEEAETRSGLVTAQISVIPDGDDLLVLDIHGLHIQVESWKERRVEWSLVSKLPPEEPSGQED